ncbi:hypothetical protein PAALTS15_09334 [Paenibacillus alvei TS-15]|uniref:Lipoprotein n=1 Tax=Paenibacillus alvei TS-15 TaxID=1117108 RepID=S9SP13_PAEAL|nr:hypothetical protein [Paenibacillus alvei]EPY07502.1 hypothetical protein PAALTS15_09334 [Paenibacillus alvei TS-15]
MMFRIIIILITAATLITACNSNEAAKDNREVIIENQESVTTDGKHGDQQNEKKFEQAPNQSNESEDHKKWASLPEYNKIVEQIGSEDYEFETETDNKGKRVLLIADKDGNKQYKTIYIKNTKRLKIIKIKGEGLLFNGILD